MSAAAGLVFSATGLMLTWSIAALWVLLQPRSPRARRALILAAIVYLLATTYVFPAAVARLWNAGFHKFVRADVAGGTRVAVVILGAGTDTVVGWNGSLSMMSDAGTARVLESIRVYREIDPAWIVSSGGQPDPDDIDTPAAFLMRDALVAAGVPPTRIVTEATSRDTHDEAVLVAPILRGLHVDRVVLVTSDVHMRRSLQTFRAVGIDAVPAIAPDSGLARRWSHWLMPTNGGLAFTSQLVHELLGVPYYWAHGWLR